MNANRPAGCAALAEALGEPLAGTSSVARSWLAIEQPGPWGRDALSASHLDHGLARELSALAAGTGVRIVLIRRPGNHPDRHRPAPRTVYLAHTAPGRTWLSRATVADSKELLDLDFARAGAGESGLFGTPVSDRVLLVCTNGRRDVCCALLGRPIAAQLAATAGDQVWECTHLGGHRFAPTAVLLPTGYSYGRLTTELGARLLTDDLVLENCRGRSTWSAAGQVAELAVRSSVRADADAVTVSAVDELPGGGWLVTVGHGDGRRWRVAVEAREVAASRPASCGAVPKPAEALVPVRVRAG